MRALIVDDNAKLARALHGAFHEQGYCVDVAGTGEEAEEMAASDAYDIYILDLMLPDADGIGVCRNIRRMGVVKPILMLTGLTKLEHRVNGLDAGADDFLSKPFQYEELMARVRALFRRGQATDGRRLRCGAIEVDIVARTVKVDGELVVLTAKEFSILENFLRHQGVVLSRNEIFQSIWAEEVEVPSNRVDAYVSKIRSRLRAAGADGYIQTVIRAGYRFEAPGAAAL